MQERNLEQELHGKLPSYLKPGNVGSFNKVTWPFWSLVSFNFGANPTYGPTTRQTQNFQVSQEAALLLMGITRASEDYTVASELAPLQIDIKDRQSSRQFNDIPIPLQAIARNGQMSALPTPLLLMPNAFIDVVASSWLTAAAAAAVGTGKFTLTFFGYRIRTEDAGKVLSSVFGS